MKLCIAEKPIFAKGIIDEGWHLYSQKTPANSGPIPVTINITKKKRLKTNWKMRRKNRATRDF